MKSHVIKHNTKDEYIAISDEIGIFEVSLENAQLFSSLNEAKMCLEDNVMENCSVYEVEITLLL